ncbi:MAG: tetratricopeptide repeat protein [Deltaproteobacteria bacterium]|nr:tetratricopeptide repeat protein [Deltaproteobacteria bacterium]NIS77385.1 tetratricopeptide repeat protein [Deltaproteobacteria bacterium]
MLKLKLSGLLLPSLAALVLLSCMGAAASGSTFRTQEVGEAVPGFALKDAEGRDVTFTPADGKVKLVAFVSVTKNSKSRKMLGTLDRIYQEVSRKGVGVYVVVSYEDRAEDVKAFLEEEKITLPLVFDSDRKVYGDWGLFVLPATAIVDGEGKLAFEHSSYDMEYENIVGGKVKVLAGAMTEADYEKLVRPGDEVQKSAGQTEAERLIILGKKLSSKGMHEKAAEKFMEAVDKDPENLEARTLYAESLGKSGKVDEAITELNLVLEKSPNMRDARIALGIVLIKKGDYDGAVENLTSASMLNPRPQRAYYWLGNAYEKKGDLENAVKFYRKALKRVLGE